MHEIPLLNLYYKFDYFFCAIDKQVRHVLEAIYRVRTLEWVWGYSPCMGPGVLSVAENGLGHFKWLE